MYILVPMRPKSIHLLTLLATLALIGCGIAEPRKDSVATSDSVLATSIEGLVRTERSDLDVDKYIRLYTRDGPDDIEGLYLIPIDDLPHGWKPGTSYWVKRSEFPIVMDGGCSVIEIRYNISSKTLVSVSCNGDA